MNLFKMFFVLLLLTALGMGAVWQRIEVTRLGYAEQRLRARRRQLQEENERLLYEVNALSAPDRLMRLMEKNDAVLAPPVSVLKLDEGDAALARPATAQARGEGL